MEIAVMLGLMVLGALVTTAAYRLGHQAGLTEGFQLGMFFSSGVVDEEYDDEEAE